MGDYNVSNSEIKVFRECRRKWWLQYILRLRKQGITLVGPLPLGSRIHKALEGYYGKGADLLATYTKLVEDDRFVLMGEGGDISKFDDEADLGRIMLEGYLEWVAEEGVDANLEVIGVEEIMRYPMLNGAVTLMGKLDLRVRDKMNETKMVLDFKHLDVHEPVLTPSGWVEIGEIKPGDRVIGSDWQPTTVLGLSERSVQPTYRIEFTDGTYSIASDTHAWPAHVYKQSAPQRFRTTLEIKEFLERPGQRDVYITGITPSELGGSDPAVDPYLLGCWIANGSTAQNLGSTRIHDGAHEAAVLHEAGLTPRVSGGGRVTSIEAAGPAALNRYLRESGLIGKRSVERWIPWDALLASATFRTRLLHGLMDSDGGMTGDSTSAYFTPSENLAEDVALLVRSLGGHASVRKKPSPRYTYRGETRYGADAYDVNIRCAWNPFVAHEKNKAKWEAVESRRKVSRQHLLKKVKSVTFIGDRECVCIMVSAEDHLFVTRGGTLTKNTAASFSDFHLTGHLNPQLRTYQMLDALTNPDEGRIEGGIYRLLKKVKRSARATPPFYEDIVIRHNKYVMRSFWMQLQGVLRDMVMARDALLSGGDPMVHAYPNPTRNCTWSCPFIEVCPMFDDGSDVDTALNDMYVETDPYERYEDAGDGSGSE